MSNASWATVIPKVRDPAIGVAFVVKNSKVDKSRTLQGPDTLRDLNERNIKNVPTLVAHEHIEASPRFRDSTTLDYNKSTSSL